VTEKWEFIRCVGNFDWAFTWSFAVTGKEKESKKQERKVGVVSATFSEPLKGSFPFQKIYLS
jgi:hypothetical protein